MSNIKSIWFLWQILHCSRSFHKYSFIIHLHFRQPSHFNLWFYLITSPSSSHVALFIVNQFKFGSSFVNLDVYVNWTMSLVLIEMDCWHVWRWILKVIENSITSSTCSLLIRYSWFPSFLLLFYRVFTSPYGEALPQSTTLNCNIIETFYAIDPRKASSSSIRISRGPNVITGHTFESRGAVRTRHRYVQSK